MFDITVDEKTVQKHYENVKEKCICEIQKMKTISFTKQQEDFIDFTEEQLKLVNEKFQAFLTWLEENEHLQAIISAKPKELLEIYREIVDNFSFEIITTNKKGEQNKREVFGTCGVNGKTIKEEIEKIFNYKWFRDEYAYQFTKDMNVNICPYCNREFTFTVVSENTCKKITRPEIDHYFPQYKYPMFSISFYNLIPSGHICNSSIKGTEFMSIEKYLHPYVDEEKSFKFYLDMKDDVVLSTEILLDANSNDKVDKTIDFFKLREIYRYHNNIAEDIVDLYRRYTPQKICDYLLLLKKLDTEHYERMNVENILEILYRSYIVKNPDSEMLGKLRDDLYSEIHDVYIKNMKDCITE